MLVSSLAVNPRSTVKVAFAAEAVPVNVTLFELLGVSLPPWQVLAPVAPLSEPASNTPLVFIPLNTK
jgi:hypothetical protein